MYSQVNAAVTGMSMTFMLMATAFIILHNVAEPQQFLSKVFIHN
jgi:hypothetical protein